MATHFDTHHEAYERRLAVRESLPPTEPRHVVAGAIFLFLFLVGLATSAHVVANRALPIDAMYATPLGVGP